MKYTSTRSASVVASFEDAICSGYAPDGGLFVPVEVPAFTRDELKQWAALGYVDLAFTIFRRFIAEEEVPDQKLREICDTAFVGFQDPSHAVAVVKIGSMFISELFHGPTFCFKDLGMRVTIGLLSYFATKRNRRITLLVSTTGDTGPAAVQAVADIANPLITILVHYPEGQISEFQRKQMTCLHSDMVIVAAFQGGGDDMDLPIKSMLTQQDPTSGRYLTGVNSYNFARPMAQIVHHVWTYLRVIELCSDKHLGDEINIVLPTGAMGNITGGEIARQMGLPIRKFCAAVNVNDITHRVIQTGRFHKSDAMIKTLSDAINIQIPYNFERLVFYLTDCNHDLVNAWMTAVDQTAKLDLESAWVEKLQSKYDSQKITDFEMCEAMKKMTEQFDYFADPHTSVAIAAAEKLGYSSMTEFPVAILATASPCKFKESVTIALGEDAWNRFRDNHFPSKAAELLSKNEVVPVLYAILDGESLSDAQIRWASQASELIDRLAQSV